MVLSAVAEGAYWALLAWLAWSSPSMPVALWIAVGLFTLVALAWPVRTDRSIGVMGASHIWLLAALFTANVHRPAMSLSDPMHLCGLVLGACLLLIGICYLVDDRRLGRKWTSLRKEMTWAGILLLVASLAMVGLIQGALALRSNQPIEPGSAGFLLSMVLWLSTWFGLDAHFRRPVEVDGGAVRAWLFGSWHVLGFVACLLVVAIRTI